MFVDNDMFKHKEYIKTRWASAENYDAKVGEGGKANFGRKGSACRGLPAGDSFTMAHAEGMGTIRRFWITISERDPELLRGIVLRIYWDNSEKPAVEVPIADFFCQSTGRLEKFENAWFDNPEGRSFNCRIPMPFKKAFKMTVTNESSKNLSMFFYDVNFTLGDEHDDSTCYFHSHFRRENPTTLRKDFEILPKVNGKGRYLGCSIGVIADTKKYRQTWWGEGEVKIYLDGDTDYPTLCGTGTEDYISTGWGQGQYSCMWHGCPVADAQNMRYSFYRLHGPDPIYFNSDIRVTIQQIGCGSNWDLLKSVLEKTVDKIVKCGDGNSFITEDELKEESKLFLFEREDDWCAVSYFYLNTPTSDLSPIANYEKRVEGLI
ncbi:MAG: glycoside hydrolase family 172 protein [Armatimonadota bacterium]